MMRMNVFRVALLLLPLAVSPLRGADGPPAPQTTLAQGLLKQFEGLLSDPNSYAIRARRECAAFPEGDLFPYTMPALAYANLAASDAKLRPKAQRRVAQLIELLKPAVARRVGQLEGLTDYGRHATYLGQLDLVLGCHRLVGGDGRYDAIHRAISDSLHAALVRQKGRPLDSYPYLTWTFDTIPCLLSLHLYDRRTGRPRSREAIARHLQWLADSATDKTTGLPYSRVDGQVAPRGCEISLRICLVAQWDQALARSLYEKYVQAFWLERGAVAGSAEWPFGRAGRQDVDSGPVVMGVGMSASGLGLGAAIAMGDAPRAARLCRQMADFRTVLQLMIARDPRSRAQLTMGGKINPAADYYTGFLFGDACLFYAATWHKWPTAEPSARLQADPSRLLAISTNDRARRICSAAWS